MTAWFWRFIATRAATGWIAALAVAAIAGGWIYVQGLRLQVAECRASQEVMQRYDRLAERVSKDIKADTDEKIKALREAGGDCLDADVADLLRGSAVEGGGVPDK